MTTGPPTPPIDEKTLTRAADILRRGGLVAFPTETVYGLGANALDTTAVARIFQVKGRPHFDPLIVHVPSLAAARRLTTAWPDTAQQLATAFWPGPLTLVLPKFQVSSSEFRVQDAQGPNSRLETQNSKLAPPDLVTAGLPTVAVRVPAHPVALALLRAVDLPIAAPSANRFGGVSPTTADHVQTELGDQIDLILDGGPCQTGVESTVISLIDPDRPRLLRLGGLTLEAIEQTVGPITLATPQTPDPQAEQRGQQSPGMLERHYAPRTPMQVVESISDFEFRISNFPEITHPNKSQPLKIGLIVFGRSADQTRSEIRNPKSEIHPTIEPLSPAGDLVEAAANLFAAMRRLDAAGLDLIIAERVPDTGLGRAINDRLRRAATR
ncbi:L-threonylcarbamoyladenylate synthase [Phycisphaerales bacterium AB-hyl4]|uniref:Threonylcarbamoyl-AMP synthase n=1 Tax=Natronomicrosphaera hydrolytica TaxID=3242702 RepID=A0ABV4U3I1_9BACT